MGELILRRAGLAVKIPLQKCSSSQGLNGFGEDPQFNTIDWPVNILLTLVY